MNRSKAICLALLAVFTLTPASASVINFTGEDPARTFSIWMRATYQSGDMLTNGQIATSTQTINEQIPAGVMNLIVDGLYTVDAFCVDYFVLIANGQYDVNLLGQNSINGGGRIEWMLRNTLPTINAQTDAVLKRKQGAALQLAIWDIVHDSGDGFSAGRIQMSSSSQRPTDSIVLAQANAFLAASNGHTLQGGVVYVNIQGPLAVQRLMSDNYGGGVPEPSTYALMVTGCVLLGVGRRFRKV